MAREQDSERTHDSGLTVEFSDKLLRFYTALTLQEILSRTPTSGEVIPVHDGDPEMYRELVSSSLLYREFRQLDSPIFKKLIIEQTPLLSTDSGELSDYLFQFWMGDDDQDRVLALRLKEQIPWITRQLYDRFGDMYRISHHFYFDDRSEAVFMRHKAFPFSISQFFHLNYQDTIPHQFGLHRPYIELDLLLNDEQDAYVIGLTHFETVISFIYTLYHSSLKKRASTDLQLKL